MIPWSVLLAGILLLPPAGAALDSNAGSIRGGVRRGLAAAAHLLGALSSILLAVQAGRPRASHLGWDNSSILIILLASFLWFEVVMLLRARPDRSAVRSRRHRAVARDHRTVLGPSAVPERRDHREGEIPSSPSGRDHPSEPLDAEASALLRRIVALDRLPVEEIMTPREEIIWVDARLSPGAALARMREHGRSRLPIVVEGNADRILGVIHAKDLVPVLVGQTTPQPLRRYLRRCLRVPLGHASSRLLDTFRRDRVHIGVVTDRLGRTVGLVTLSDVFRFIATGRSGGGSDAEETDR